MQRFEIRYITPPSSNTPIVSMKINVIIIHITVLDEHFPNFLCKVFAGFFGYYLAIVPKVFFLPVVPPTRVLSLYYYHSSEDVLPIFCFYLMDYIQFSIFIYIFLLDIFLIRCLSVSRSMHGPKILLRIFLSNHWIFVSCTIIVHVSLAYITIGLIIA